MRSKTVKIFKMKMLKMDKIIPTKFLRNNNHLIYISLLFFLVVYLSSFNPAYELFIDEPYYVACADNPSAGYVDHPPLAPLLLMIWKFIFGDSIYSLRFLPALAGALSVFFTGIIAKNLGGGRFSQSLAAAATASAPVFLAMSGFYSMNAFEPLLAALLLLTIIKMIIDVNMKRWIQAGILTGAGIMNKHSFIFFAAVMILSLLLTGKWKLVINKWFFSGMGLATLIILPNIIWQVINDFPSAEFYRNITADKNVYTPPLQFILMQAMAYSFISFPLWLSGIIFLIFSKRMREYKFTGFLFLILFLFMLITGSSRPDRSAFIYPIAFAGGSILLESILSKKRAVITKTIFFFLIFLGIPAGIPLTLPYLSYSQVYEYTKFLGFNTEGEKGKNPPIPQLLADRIGWKERAELVIKAYNNLSEEDKKNTIITASNYGKAGAIDYYGRQYGLPPAVSGHNNYYYWSKNRLKGNIVLKLGEKKYFEEYKHTYNDVIMTGEVYYHPYVSPNENYLTVFICKGPKHPLEEILEDSRFYY